MLMSLHPLHDFHSLVHEVDSVPVQWYLRDALKILVFVLHACSCPCIHSLVHKVDPVSVQVVLVLQVHLAAPCGLVLNHQVHQRGLVIGRDVRRPCTKISHRR